MSAPKPRILIVDESPAEVATLRQLLENDFLVSVASPMEAESLAESEDAELVLLGSETSEASLDICARLKTNPNTAALPVILLGIPEREDTEFQAMNAGAADFLPRPVRASTTRARIKVHLENQRFRGILQGLTWLDAITGIPNRENFDEALDSEWRRNARNRTPISLLLMEIDHYQGYCEQHGNQAGNEALRRMIGALTGGIQRAGDVVGRFGDQVFACVLPETDTLGAVSVGERIRAEVNSMAMPHGRSKIAPYVTLSIGIGSLVPSRNDLLEDLRSAAEEALDKAKHRGGNQVVFG